MAKEHRKGDIAQGIPTDDWNEFCRTSARVAQFFRHGNNPAQNGSPGRLVVDVFNVSGADINVEFPILKLQRPNLTDEETAKVLFAGIWFDGDTPDVDTKIGDIGILQGAVGDGLNGAAVILGHSWAEVDVTDATHTHADVIDGDNTKLASGTAGAKIIWKPTGTGVKKCVVMLGGGGGGSGSSSRLGARVITPISAATDNLSANWGSGGVHMLDPTTGEEIVPDPDPLVLVNPLQMSFGVDYWVAVEGGRIVDGSCGPWTWAALP